MKLNIAITGVGLVAPLGHTPAALLDALCAGHTAAAPVTGFDVTPFPCALGAEVTGFKASNWVAQRKNLKLMTPAVRYGIAAVKRAYADAALKGVDPDRLGLLVGNGAAFGDTVDLIPALEAGFEGGGFSSARFASAQKLINPLWLIKGLSNNVLGFASAELDARGFNQNYCNSAVGGLQAIGEAAWALMEGRAAALIAGGADSAVNPAHFTGFGRLGLLLAGDDPTAARPFDVEAAGFIPGEGAAFFSLERPQDAAARGARVLGRIVGYKDTCAGAGLL
ncbi:hypothetical protein KKB55_20710, partial [Myxococcota bacterium]|nr:hypothetical protein [Myxococcota bacterium]